MRRRTMLCAFGGTASLAVAGCLGGDDDGSGGNDGDELNSNPGGDSADGSDDTGGGAEIGNETENTANTNTAEPEGPVLDIFVDPGVAARRNDYTLTVAGARLSGAPDIEQLRIVFDENSGVGLLPLTALRAEQVQVTAEGIENPGVDAVQAGETRELLITPMNSFTLSAVEGDIVVSITALRAPNPGEFGLSLGFQNQAGETVSDVETTYEISEDT
jgi:hypothetical protein